MTLQTDPYDALLLVSFGGPEGPDDVLPFLRNVTRGRGIPPDRLAEVGQHYQAFGGRSPINDQCRALLAAIRTDLSAAGIDLPVYWGNRNWDPYLSDALEQMHRDGVRRAACFVTSAYSSYSGCRQYRENLFDAVADVAAGSGDGAGTTPPAPRLDKLRHYFNHPGFIDPFVDGTVDALARLATGGCRAPRLVYVTHSIPDAMNDVSGRVPGGPGGAYVRQHEEVASLVTDRVAERTGSRPAHELVYCSRSGPPQVPWLEPDVNDHLELLAAEGTTDGVVVVPIGFVSDHMEVIYDLDTEAAATADRLGLGFERVQTPGVDTRFVAMVRELLTERAAVERGSSPVRVAAGGMGAWWDVCPVGCCQNLRDAARPALFGADSPDPTTTVAP
jgi:ferrochelatase